VLKLEEANLIQSLRDEDDNRRKTILVTPYGWMVHYARSRGLDGLFADT
jgi:DNA-binding MarR family transcriptional regulator